MNIELTGRHIHLHDDIKQYSHKKLEKLDKFLEEPIDIHLILEVKKLRNIAELHVKHKYGQLLAKEEGPELETAVHDAVETAVKQARRAHKKAKLKKRRASKPEHWPVEVLAAESISDGDAPRVIKTNQLPIEPMTIDEASLALQQSKNDFYVFLDADTEKVSVLYRRKDQNYGLIATEL